ncbi:DUF3575 domain-containing protein [Pedobacter sp. L105]|uniref:DUF3575 domain-containing protein n=1 Tax=Pedobacter sp. L105 TaxID=1641871 RepID=UPI00131D0232|nr:DUF3575 domain-containing protein [Pedobacter sp. L105]
MESSFTKKLFAVAIVALICFTQQIKAQTTVSKDSLSNEGKNIIKMNLGALILKTYSFEYERALNSRISFAMDFRIMPKSNIPFKKQVENAVDDQETKQTISTFRTSNFAITPEVKFYLGEKGVFRGFYLAPFVSYAKYNGDGPFSYDVTQLHYTETLNFKGSLNTYTAGVMVGAQWKLTKLLYFDWWIAGPNYGTSKGSLVSDKNFIPIEEQYVRQQLAQFVSDLPLVKATSTVTSDKATIDIKGPWAGVRGGLSLGFRL